MALNPKQTAFVQEYLVDLNATQAAIRAGYSEKTAGAKGHELLKVVEITAALADAMKERAERVELSQDYVVRTLLEVVQRCMQKAPVMVRRGKEIVQLQDEEGRDVWKFDSTGANNALKLLGQHLAMFTKNINVGGNGIPTSIALVRVKPEPDDPTGD